MTTRISIQRIGQVCSIGRRRLLVLNQLLLRGEGDIIRELLETANLSRAAGNAELIVVKAIRRKQRRPKRAQLIHLPGDNRQPLREDFRHRLARLRAGSRCRGRGLHFGRSRWSRLEPCDQKSAEGRQGYPEIKRSWHFRKTARGWM